MQETGIVHKRPHFGAFDRRRRKIRKRGFLYWQGENEIVSDRKSLTEFPVENYNKYNNCQNIDHRFHEKPALKDTIAILKDKVIDHSRCYLPETQALYEAMNNFAKEFAAMLEEGIG